MKYNTQQRMMAEAELLAGEVLLWVGQPAPLRMARRHLGTLLFGLVWAAVVFMLFNMVNRFRLPMIVTDGPLPINMLLDVVLLVFFVVCLWFVSAPLRSYLEATRTVYAVTNRRAFIIAGWGRLGVRSYYGRDMPFIHHRETGGGYGDVLFAETIRRRQNLLDANPNRRPYYQPTGFFAVANSRQVEALMLEIFRPEPEPEPEETQEPQDYFNPW